MANAIVLKHTGFDTNQMPKNIPEAWDWKQLELLYLELAGQTLRVCKTGYPSLSACANAPKRWLPTDRLAVKLRLKAAEICCLFSREWRHL
ncbi:MAG: hypothetical protein ACLRP3_22910 [Escherichia sp.]